MFDTCLLSPVGSTFQGFTGCLKKDLYNQLYDVNLKEEINSLVL